jgi:prepilin-type N-terminal cleavage/methylation domain-containing protein
MQRSHRRSSAAFTMVEMLVVIGIIAILAALLLPAVNMAIKAARNAAIAVEVNQLDTAINTYKNDKGDFPPNFRDSSIVLRHIRKCYPKADPNYVAQFVTRACTMPTSGSTSPNYFIDEGESLVFWLSMTDNDPRYPFLSYYNPNNLPVNPKKFYDFNEQRLVPINTNEVQLNSGVTVTADVRSYSNKFTQDAPFIYIDSRSYVDTCRISGYGNPQDTINSYAYAENTSVGVRPYWSESKNTSITSNIWRDAYKAVNPTTFQIICAGQDGEFGDLSAVTDMKVFPGGVNYDVGDKDNITNFSGGRTLGDNIP